MSIQWSGLGPELLVRLRRDGGDPLGVQLEREIREAIRSRRLTPGERLPSSRRAQSPTGAVLAPRRRQAIAAWADTTNATVIEDDYDSEFRYDREPIGVLQGLAPNRVALIGTVSKSLSPALRLGWLLCPPALIETVVAEKTQDDRGSPILDQLALATLIRSGRFDRHLRRMRSTYAARRRALINALAAHAPRVQLQGLAAGIHAVALLPDGIDACAVAATAAERSVALYPMSRYRADGAADPPALVMGFGNLTEPTLTHGITTIADLLT